MRYQVSYLTRICCSLMIKVKAKCGSICGTRPTPGFPPSHHVYLGPYPRKVSALTSHPLPSSDGQLPRTLRGGDHCYGQCLLLPSRRVLLPQPGDQRPRMRTSHCHAHACRSTHNPAPPSRSSSFSPLLRMFHKPLFTLSCSSSPRCVVVIAS